MTFIQLSETIHRIVYNNIVLQHYWVIMFHRSFVEDYNSSWLVLPALVILHVARPTGNNICPSSCVATTGQFVSFHDRGSKTQSLGRQRKHEGFRRKCLNSPFVLHEQRADDKLAVGKKKKENSGSVTVFLINP